MFNLNGQIWDVHMASPDHPLLMRSNGTFALGSCDNISKTIYISKNVPDYKLLKVISHEITHAAMFSYNVELTVEQEELVADLIATYGQEIIYTANKIFKRISKKWGTY